jgi:nucleotide-binding universal stress UspA family protein
MNRFQKIVVPIDFSAHSLEATRVAADLARRFGASLTLIHVYDPLIFALPDGLAWVPESTIAKLFEAFRTELDSARKLALEAGAPRVATQLLEGAVAVGIVDFAQGGAFDLIVMGTHGRTGMSRLFIGSTAERVVRLAHCPVLTVKRANGVATRSKAANR